MPVRDWTRREFLGALAAFGTAGLGRLSAGLALRPRVAGGDDVFRVGFIFPESGPLAAVGEAAALGAEFGAAEAARLAQLFDKRFELVTAHADRPEAARRAAERLVEDEAVFALAGGFDAATCFALAEQADRQGVLFFNVGCTDDSLRGDRCHRTTFSVEASTAMYVDALADWLVQEAGLGRWHFVTGTSGDDATAYGRAQKALLERGGDDLGNTSVTPGTLDHAGTLERLQEERPDVAFLNLDWTSQAAFLEQYNELGPQFEVAGPSSGTFQLWISSPATRAGIWPTLWHSKLFRYGAKQLNDRFKARSGRPFDAHGWAAWLAVKIQAETAFRAGTTETSQLVQFLENDRAQFDGHKGRRLSFRSWDHQLRQPLYLIRAKRQTEDGGDVFENVAELPLGRPGPGRTSRELLDQLGEGESESACHFADL